MRLPPLAGLLLLAAACGKSDGGAAPPPPASASASASIPGGAPAGIDALARAVLACRAYAQSFDLACPAMRAWSEDHADFIEGKADAALVAMLGSDDEKIRYLGAYKLKDHGKRFATDRALAGAVVTAAEKETSRFSGGELGQVVGHLRVADTGTFDRVAPLARTHPLVEMRRGLVANLLFANQDDARVYALVRDLVKDGDRAVAQTALNAFWLGGAKNADATCQIFADHLEDPDDALAAMASNYLSWQKRCAARYDTLLSTLEKRVKAGPAALGATSYLTAAQHVCEDDKASAPQRKRAVEIGHQVAARKEFSAWVRGAALEAVLRCDPGDAGRAFVGTYRQDSEKYVSDRAGELLRKK